MIVRRKWIDVLLASTWIHSIIITCKSTFICFIISFLSVFLFIQRFCRWNQHYPVRIDIRQKIEYLLSKIYNRFLHLFDIEYFVLYSFRWNSNVDDSSTILHIWNQCKTSNECSTYSSLRRHSSTCLYQSPKSSYKLIKMKIAFID